MTEVFTLVDFACMPTLSRQTAGLVMIGIVAGVLSALFAVVLYPNRRAAVVRFTGIAGVIILCIVLALFAYFTAFKCSVILLDGSKQTEIEVMTYRYPELGMSVVIIPRDNEIPLLNKYFNNRKESR